MMDDCVKSVEGRPDCGTAGPHQGKRTREMKSTENMAESLLNSKVQGQRELEIFKTLLKDISSSSAAKVVPFCVQMTFLC